MRRALLVLPVLLAVGISGCGATIKPDGAAKSVVDVVSKQTKFKPTDDCTFTGPEGKPYTAHMKVTKVDGDDVYFEIRSRPS